MRELIRHAMKLIHYIMELILQMLHLNSANDEIRTT